MKNLGLSVIAERVLDPGNEVVFLVRKRMVTAFCKNNLEVQPSQLRTKRNYFFVSVDRNCFYVRMF